MLSDYESLWKAFIRPARQTYSELDLGPRRGRFFGIDYAREDMEVINQQGKVLKCSLFEPIAKSQFDCVVYCHGNSGCRLEAITYLEQLISHGIALCCFDFNGSGMTQGEFVSLGFHEQHDLKCVIKHLRDFPRIRQLALLGRSMGAVTALLYASIDSDFAGVIADSPFSNLKDLALELAQSKISLPTFLLEGILSLISNSIAERVGFRLEQLDLNEVISNIRVPVLFVASPDDKLVSIAHSKKLQRLCSSAQLHMITGEHNAERTIEYKQLITEYFHNQFAKKADGDAHIRPQTTARLLPNNSPLPPSLKHTLPADRNQTSFSKKLMQTPVAATHARYLSGIIPKATTSCPIELKRTPSLYSMTNRNKNNAELSSAQGGFHHRLPATQQPSTPSDPFTQRSNLLQSTHHVSAPQLKKFSNISLLDNTRAAELPIPMHQNSASHERENMSLVTSCTPRQFERFTSNNPPLQAIQDNTIVRPTVDFNKSEKKHSARNTPSSSQPGGDSSYKQQFYQMSNHSANTVRSLSGHQQISSSNILQQQLNQPHISLSNQYDQLTQRGQSQLSSEANHPSIGHCEQSQNEHSSRGLQINSFISTSVTPLPASESASQKVKGLRKYSIEPLQKISPQFRPSSRAFPSSSLHITSGQSKEAELSSLANPAIILQPLSCSSLSSHLQTVRKQFPDKTNKQYRMAVGGRMSSLFHKRPETDKHLQLSTLFSINDEFQDAEDEHQQNAFASGDILNTELKYKLRRDDDNRTAADCFPQEECFINKPGSSFIQQKQLSTSSSTKTFLPQTSEQTQSSQSRLPSQPAYFFAPIKPAVIMNTKRSNNESITNDQQYLQSSSSSTLVKQMKGIPSVHATAAGVSSNVCSSKQMQMKESEGRFFQIPQAHSLSQLSSTTSSDKMSDSATFQARQAQTNDTSVFILSETPINFRQESSSIKPTISEFQMLSSMQRQTKELSEQHLINQEKRVKEKQENFRSLSNQQKQQIDVPSYEPINRQIGRYMQNPQKTSIVEQQQFKEQNRVIHPRFQSEHVSASRKDILINKEGMEKLLVIPTSVETPEYRSISSHILATELRSTQIQQLAGMEALDQLRQHKTSKEIQEQIFNNSSQFTSTPLFKLGSAYSQVLVQNQQTSNHETFKTQQVFQGLCSKKKGNPQEGLQMPNEVKQRANPLNFFNQSSSGVKKTLQLPISGQFSITGSIAANSGHTKS